MTTLSKLSLLTSLYFSQGLPYGFFTQALPTFLRQKGISLEWIGLSALLTIPWALKFLWAPLVDRHGSSAFGRRRSWIVPLQALAVANLTVLTFIDPSEHMALMCLAVLVTNLFAATQDIATDGFAVDLLEPHERGLANGIQVAGYRVGMVVGGGVMLVVLGDVGWSATFAMMAGMLACATVPILMHRERPMPAKAFESVRMDAILDVLRRPGMARWILVLVIYKSGDYFATGMIRPMLVDLGYTTAHVGTLIGVVGCIAGLVGAMLGGWGAQRLGRHRALLVFGLLQAVSVMLYALPALGFKSWPLLNAICAIEHLASGMATVTLFTMMMDRCGRETAATDYTVQASIVVLANGLAASLSGVSASAFGYVGHYAVSGLYCFAGLGWIALLLGREEKAVA